MWLIGIVCLFSVAYIFNPWIIPVSMYIFWPEFGGTPTQLSHANALYLAMICMWMSILFSKGFFAILAGMYAGSKLANKK